MAAKYVSFIMKSKSLGILCSIFSAIFLYAGEDTSVLPTGEMDLLGTEITTTDTVTARLQSFIDNIETFNQILPQEKVYLHFDNTAYYVGETIWFKAYVVTSERHCPTAYSKILYVELITQEGEIVERKRLKIEDGQCHGEFQIKEDYYAGYYEIRAYTQAMLNFGRIQQPYEKEIRAFFFNEDYVKTFFQENGTLFSRVLPIYNTPSEPGAYHQKVIRLRPKVTGMDPWMDPIKPPIEVKFYPEGGNLVEGLMSRVAFEATTEDGQHIEVDGLVRNDNKTFCRFKTAGKGRGEFYVLSDSKERQRIEIHYKGKNYTYQLPEIQPRGYVMTVNPVYQKDVRVNIQRSANQPVEELGLSIICRGRPYVFNTLIPDSSGLFQMKIPTDLLPTGVNQLTLFNSRGEVFAERLIFVNHKEYERYRIQVSGEMAYYGPYDPIALTFYFYEGKEKKQGNRDGQNTNTNTTTNTTEPFISNTFSVSIGDEETREANVSLQNARTNLLLSSDVYGFIENPEYYFETDNKRRHYELDLLLLVQGWRRYNWQEMSGNSPFEYLHPYERSFELSGKVYPLLGFKKEQKERLENGILVEATLLLDTLEYNGHDSTDAKGRFSFHLPEFEGEGVLFIKAVEKKEKWKNSDNEFFSNPLRYEFEEGGHWFDAYMPLNENYIPHVRDFTYAEIHPKNVLTLPSDKTTTEKEEGENKDAVAYQLNLPEAKVSRKRILHTIDYSQPAYKLDPFEELNFQMDMGMFYGLISKSSVAYNACVRFGLRGINMELVNRRPMENRLLGRPFKYEVVTDDSDSKEEKVPNIFGNDSLRIEEGLYYMTRFMDLHEMFRKKNEVDNIKGDIPESIPFRKYSGIENVERISIYTDKNTRDYYSMNEVLKSYSYDYIINYECFQEKSHIIPVYKGRCLTYRGYSSVASFYHPNYKNIRFSELPNDCRRTLYWNPDVQPDSTGVAHIEFYNNSTTTSLYINAETVTKNGVPVVYSE